MSLSYKNRLDAIQASNKVTSKFANQKVVTMEKLYSSVDPDDASHRLKKISSNVVLKSKLERDNAKNNRVAALQLGVQHKSIDLKDHDVYNNIPLHDKDEYIR